MPRQGPQGRGEGACVAGGEARQQHPLLLEQLDSRRRWWLFRDDFYCEDEALSPEEVRALLLDRLSQRERRLRRAVALMEQGEGEAPAVLRGRIPDGVRAFVWQRDGGRCVACGSREPNCP